MLRNQVEIFFDIFINFRQIINLKYLVFHNNNFFNIAAMWKNLFDLWPSLETAQHRVSVGLIDGMNDSVYAKIGVNCYNCDVVLESSICKY